MTPLAVAGMVLSWVITLVAAWLGYELVRRHGRILIRTLSLERYMEALQEQVEDLKPPGLPTGIPAGLTAPPFWLPDLDGKQVGLSSFLGRRVVLIFFSPECSHCQHMASDLAKLPWDGSGGHPIPVVVSTGEPEANRMLVEEHGIRCPFLLQEENEVAATYGALGTPLGYQVDERGVLASHMQIGASALLALFETASQAPNGNHAAGNPEKSLDQDVTVRGDRRTALQRNLHRGGGLRPGVLAPVFNLPRLDGGRMAIDEYRGRRLLLVFSSPDCPTCDGVIPELEKIHRAAPELSILMVTRGTPDENRSKLAEMGVTFPVGLQANWDVSRRYRKFGTPAAYIIDEEGKIASGVAMGGAILALAVQAAETPRKQVTGKGVVMMKWRKSR